MKVIFVNFPLLFAFSGNPKMLLVRLPLVRLANDYKKGQTNQRDACIA